MSDRDDGAPLADSPSLLDGFVDAAFRATAAPRLLRAVGGGALIGAGVVALAPDVLTATGLAGVLRPVASLGTVGVLAVVAGVVAVRALRTDTATETGEAVDGPIYGGPDGTDVPTVGSRIDEPLATLRDPDATRSVGERAAARSTLRTDLRETATAVLTTVEGLAPAAARSRVEDGTWTDDPRAAAFLAREGAVAVPVWLRIADWLRGAPTARRAEATVAEIARRADLDPDGRASPPIATDARADPAADDEGDRAAALADLDAHLIDDPASGAADGGDRP